VNADRASGSLKSATTRHARQRLDRKARAGDNRSTTTAPFDRLPILADALEDAGCDNANILNHCRQPGVHVRGCWVVDLVLGKE
jgi:hypothetical protein